MWFGNTAAPEDLRGVRAAARQSGIGERIERLPEQWQTPLSRELAGGQDLSGGEWQRLALARAFYRSEAALVVLDEPTYGVDPAAEGDIWERVRTWIARRTALVVSHRLGLTRFVDEIVVMDRVASWNAATTRRSCRQTASMRACSAHRRGRTWTEPRLRQRVAR